MNKNVLDEKRGKRMDGARREENECRNKTRKFLEKFLRVRAANVHVYIGEVLKLPRASFLR